MVILDRVEVIEGECWPWRGALRPTGYGTFTLRRGSWRTSKPAHRAVYELLVGPIPEGLEIDHLCSNPGCVNPEHLEPVTHLENVWRAVRRRGGEVPPWMLADEVA